MTDGSNDPGQGLRLLHRVDPDARLLTYVRTTEAALRDAAFLDGRSIFWEGAPEVDGFPNVPKASFAPAGIERFIFHVSFCGSTLLASALGDACDAIVLKEPHCLVDLADWKAGRQGQGADPDFLPMLGHARNALRGLDARPVVVKPSNWANNLLAALSTPFAQTAQVHVTMERRAFIAAVFRGGRDRLAFTARVASHLASAFEDGDGLVRSAIAASDEPLARVANLCALTHALQCHLFEDAASRLPRQAVQRIDFDEIRDDLKGAVRKAASALRLELPEPALDRAVSRWGKKDPKRGGADFSRAAHDRASADVARLHAASIDAALAWSAGLPKLVSKEN